MKYNGITIHSNYAPEKEASRFVNRINIKKGRYLFLISGAGGGYLKKELLARYPGSIAVSIFYNPNSSEGVCEKTDSWVYGHNITLRSFLETAIPDFLIPVLRIIEWPPCAKAFPEEHKKVSEDIYSFLEERNGSIVTTVNFSKRWTKNTIINISLIKRCIDPLHFKTKKPVIVTAAGPSLSRTIPFLKRNRNIFFVVALPSSLEALKNAAVYPDLIVNTDPGFWNRYHFNHSFTKDIPVAMPLSASVHKNTGPVLLINQSTAFDKVYFSLSALPSINIPETGTVAGTALFLSLKISDQYVFIAGLDLEYQDVHSHVKPHSFEILLRYGETRTKPYLTTLYSRMISSRIKGNNRAYQTYANWFNKIDLGNRICRINPSGIKLNFFRSVSLSEVQNIIGNLRENESSGTSSGRLELIPVNSMNTTVLFDSIFSRLTSLKDTITGINSFSQLSALINRDKQLSDFIKLLSLREILRCVKLLSSGESWDSPLGVIFPTKISPGLT